MKTWMKFYSNHFNLDVSTVGEKYSTWFRLEMLSMELQSPIGGTMGTTKSHFVEEIKDSWQ